MPRLLHGPGSWQRVTVAAAALVLAVAALGLLLWSLTTTSAWPAWLTSMAAILAVVLPALGMSAGMLAWVVRADRAEAGRFPERVDGPSRPPTAGLHGDGGGAGGLPIGVPFGRLPARIRGRDASVAELCTSLALRRFIWFPLPRRTRPDRVRVLAGMGGVGKSTVALAAAQAARSRGWRVWWVTATDTASLAGGMLEILFQLGAPETVTGPVREGAPAAR